MSPEEFCFWLRGIASSPMQVGDMGALVLRQASKVLDHIAAKTPIKVPALKQVGVPDFCFHNVHNAESCAACAGKFAPRTRLYCVSLPTGTKVVYIGEHAHEDAVQLKRECAGDGVAKSAVEPASEAREPSALGLRAEELG